MAFKFVLMLSVVVFAAQASPTPDHHDDQTKINAAQTILTLTNSLVGIKNLLTGRHLSAHLFFMYLKQYI